MKTGSIILALTGELVTEPGPFLALDFEDRQVKETFIRFRGIEVRVSTVFLPGSDILASSKSRPGIMLETMTFSTSKKILNRLTARYYTREQAIVGHRIIVELVRYELKKTQPNVHRIKAAARYYSKKG